MADEKLLKNELLKDELLKDELLQDELLSEEQLEQVAGGNIYQMEDDAAQFKKLGVLSEHINDHDKIALKAAFAAYGITTEQHGRGFEFGITTPGEDNKYFLGNQEISRATAWQIVNSKWAQGNRPRVF
jgi:hypothetical protein